ncbi:hypothetical protein [Corynebacterium freneyi]|uniref:hypothetical protein n=1 Tax=Corynebacterium freneyi TaxID=134034 RepID=UPI0012EC0718|nr:hypothetical protein [Corynebacterium freneyi]
MADDYVAPDGTMTPADLSARIRPHDLESGREWARGDLQGALGKLQAGVKDGLLAGIADALKGVARPGFEAVADAFQDGQLALKNRLDLLSPLLDYGSAYMDAQGGFLQFGNNHGVMPFNNQIGPMRGCELHDNGIRLLAAGLWDVRCQMAFSGNTLGVGNGTVEWYIRVYRPDGVLFSQQVGIEANVWTKTSTIVSSVVVPEPGYVVKVEVKWIHGSRKLLGGPTNNRLVVQHISNRTGVGGTGAENSTTPEIDDDPDAPIGGVSEEEEP